MTESARSDVENESLQLMQEEVKLHEGKFTSVNSLQLYRLPSLRKKPLAFSSCHEERKGSKFQRLSVFAMSCLLSGSSVPAHALAV